MSLDSELKPGHLITFYNEKKKCSGKIGLYLTFCTDVALETELVVAVTANSRFYRNKSPSSELDSQESRQTAST